MNNEQEYWKGLIEDLRDPEGPGLTVAEIAAEAGVDDRQVFRWLQGDRPKGLVALRVYLFHVKRCPPGRCPPDHSVMSVKG